MEMIVKQEIQTCLMALFTPTINVVAAPQNIILRVIPYNGKNQSLGTNFNMILNEFVNVVICKGCLLYTSRCV